MSQKKQSSYTIEQVDVTPELAAELWQNRAPNRKISEKHLRRLIESRNQDDWNLQPYGLVIGTDGKLYGGQHRVLMVIRTGLTTPMIIIGNVPPEIAVRMDQDERPQRPHEAAMKMGLDWMNDKAEQTVKAIYEMEPGKGARNWRCGEIIELMKAHEDALKFIARVMAAHKAGLSTAAVRAAICRAYYHCDLNRLERFITVLMSGGESETPVEKVIAKLCNWLRDDQKKLQAAKNGGFCPRKQAYLRTENAIRHFMNERVVEILTPVTRELFPLPEQFRIDW